MTPGDALSQQVLKRTGAPAVIGAVIDRDGLVHTECAGSRRLGEPDPVTVDDLWHIGSNAKAMTAALYARLVEAGLARWETCAPKLFADLDLHPAWASTTMEDLLAHRTGLSDRAALPPAWLIAARADQRPVSDQRTALAASALSKPPGGRAGQFAYANINYILAGAAIERILAIPWEAAIAEHLFAPLGFNGAAFGAPTGQQPWGHAKPFLGRLTPVDPAGPSDNPPALGPAGRIHMTIADHARFTQLFLTDGGGYLTPDSIRRLVTPRGKGRLAIYALGWVVLPGRPRSRGSLLTHEGSNTLWTSVAFASPGRGVAVVTASNAFARGQTAARLLARRLMERFDPR